MMRKIFGTDGVRGRVNCAPMLASTILDLAIATAAHFKKGDHRHRAIIGKDTRLSGYMLEQALTAGLLSMGMDVLLVGPLPTPAIAMLTRSMRADLGIMISASHNPYEDNGIKLFGPDGYKLSDDIELDIEKKLEHLNAGRGPTPVGPSELGRAKRIDDAPGRYIEAVKATFPKGRLDGLKIVVDCAHGAAYKVAPTVLSELGAEIIAIGVEPDGFNINKECGAVHPQTLAQRVIKEGAHLGLALDGDADRLQIVDEKGHIINGDQILALIAREWFAQGRLSQAKIVTTVMSNLGLEHFLKKIGIDMYRSAVGDRYVVEEMRRYHVNLGGEQSGHIILGDYSPTGDGLMAALQILPLLEQGRKPASDVLHVFKPLPQILKNVRLSDQSLLERPAIQQAISKAQSSLNGTGRLLIRKSGTEPLIRIMAEGPDEKTIQDIVDQLAEIFSSR